MEYLSPGWVGLYAWIAVALFVPLYILVLFRREWWALAKRIRERRKRQRGISDG